MKINHHTFGGVFDPAGISSYLQSSFICFVEISDAFLSPAMPLRTFVLLRLLSEPFVSQDDEIKAVYGSFFSAGVTAATAACRLLHSDASCGCPAGVPGAGLKARSPLLTSCWHPLP